MQISYTYKSEKSLSLTLETVYDPCRKCSNKNTFSKSFLGFEIIVAHRGWNAKLKGQLSYICYSANYFCDTTPDEENLRQTLSVESSFFVVPVLRYCEYHYCIEYHQ